MNSSIENDASEGSDYNSDDSDLEDVPLTLPQDDSDSEYSSSPRLTGTLPVAARPQTEQFAPPPAPRIPFSLKLADVTSQTSTSGISIHPNEAAGCSTARAPMKPPRLNLPNPASPARTPRVAEELSTIPSCSSGNSSRPHERVTVELISHAFVIGSSLIRRGQEAGLAIKDIVFKRCSSVFGIDVEDLSLYRLQKFQSDEAPEATHIGVAVRNSSFTLAALEELLAENRRLMALQERNAHIIDSMHNDYRESRQEVVRMQMRSAEHEVECKRLQARCKALEESNGDAVMWQQRCLALEEKALATEQERDNLRLQLERSDQLRVQAFHALTALRREFEAVKASLPVNQEPANHPGIGALAAPYRMGSAGSMKSPSSASSGRGSTTPRVCYQ